MWVQFNIYLKHLQVDIELNPHDLQVDIEDHVGSIQYLLEDASKPLRNVTIEVDGGYLV